MNRPPDLKETYGSVTLEVESRHAPRGSLLPVFDTFIRDRETQELLRETFGYHDRADAIEQGRADAKETDANRDKFPPLYPEES